jgi:hypothetical protein
MLLNLFWCLEQKTKVPELTYNILSYLIDDDYIYNMKYNIKESEEEIFNNILNILLYNYDLNKYNRINVYLSECDSCHLTIPYKYISYTICNNHKHICNPCTVICSCFSTGISKSCDIDECDLSGIVTKCNHCFKNMVHEQTFDIITEHGEDDGESCIGCCLSQLEIIRQIDREYCRNCIKQFNLDQDHITSFELE